MAKSRRTRTPKASIGRGSHPLTCRISDALYNDLVEADRQRDHGIAEEVRSRLSTSFEFDRAIGSRLGREEGLYLTTWAARIREATYAAGDEPSRWIEYADGLPFSTDPDQPEERARLEKLVREKVVAFVEQAKTELEGWTTEDLIGPVRSAPGTPPEERRAKVNQQILLRHKAIALNKIKRNEAKRERRNLLADAKFFAIYSNSKDPGHQAAVKTMNMAIRAIDDSSAEISKLEGGSLD
jgi:hypothetical protein